ncbi:MAG: four helix bundle protein [Ignavibacteria bacterium]
MNNENTKSRFEDLIVWKKARELRVELSEIVRAFPKKEFYVLSNQIIRASRSVTNNIAEGYGRYHYQENIQFCRHARGSLYELIDHLIICLDENYLNIEKFSDLRFKILNTIKILNGYISYLKKQKELN